MKIGITGHRGFIGWHLRCYLKTLTAVTEVRTADRETFAKPLQLKQFVAGLDTIIHLAGVNRATDEALITGNLQPAAQLIRALESSHSHATVLFASSIYSQDPTTQSPYGEGKARAGQLFQKWAEHTGGRSINLIIPHVFGEYGRPHYNSAVATFCHQITRGETLTINPEGRLELIHVQDLVEHIYQYANDPHCSGEKHIDGVKMTVGEIADKLQTLYQDYICNQRLPDLSSPFDRNLFNTLRGAIPHQARVITPTHHQDERGWLVETVKTSSAGQCFVSTTKPGITRGNHFHRRKVERFFVLQGQAHIELRKLFTDDIIQYQLTGEAPSYIDIPTLHTHSITNTGSETLITLFWADEILDPNNADTYAEPCRLVL